MNNLDLPFDEWVAPKENIVVRVWFKDAKYDEYDFFLLDSYEIPGDIMLKLEMADNIDCPTYKHLRFRRLSDIVAIAIADSDNQHLEEFRTNEEKEVE